MQILATSFPSATRLLRLLDVGGMGEVWAARNEAHPEELRHQIPAARARGAAGIAFEQFIREAETARRPEPPAIVEVFDVAQAEDGRPFIVMELLGGRASKRASSAPGR